MTMPVRHDGTFDELKDLIDAVKGAEREEAINALLARFQDYVHRLASAHLGSSARQKFDSHDIQQAVLLHLVQRFRTGRVELRSEAQFVDLLGKMTFRKFLDMVRYYRRIRRSMERELAIGRPGDSETPGNLLEPAANGPGPRTELMNREWENIWTVLEEILPPDEFYLFEQRYREYVSPEELGKRMGRSAGAIRMQMVRICDEIRPKLIPYMPLLAR